ncbi:hypothetical protein ACG02S_11520 [Roseateles sp. DC23W]|uniref:YqjK-like protein n=1 Tax=Pelomonas dachongensis TaxID=3299029 RepID=A0ABW7EM34_9BURK
MIPRLPQVAEQRARRKDDLLLASHVLRDQVGLAGRDLGQRADRWGHRVQTVRRWLSDPFVVAAVGGGAALFAASPPTRRGRFWRTAQWALMMWQAYRSRR